MADGQFIQIEGLDGTGKTTLAKALTAITSGDDLPSCIERTDDLFALGDTLITSGVRFDYMKAPGFTQLGGHIRRAILDGVATAREEHDGGIRYVTHVLKDKPEQGVIEGLHVTDLRDLTFSAIYPALRQGRWVICDRYVNSTRAYAVGGYYVERDWIERLIELMVPPVESRLVLWCDMPAKLAMRRLANAAKQHGGDIGDRQDSFFYNRVQYEYSRLYVNNRNWQRIDAERTPTQMLIDALKIIIETFHLS